MTTQTATLPIEGLDCIDCARGLEGGVAQLEGVHSSEVNFAASSLAVEFDARATNLSGILGRIREMGYDAAPTEEVLLHIQGLDCADCAAKLEQAIASLPQVLEARVIFATAQMRVRGFSRQDLIESVVQTTAAAGYPARLDALTDEDPAQSAAGWRGLWEGNQRVAFTLASAAFLIAGAVMRLLGVRGLAPTVSYALAILFGGYYVARSGWAVWRTTRSLDMNALMTIAAVGAVAIGEWAEGATAMALFSVGNSLEAMTMDRARQAIRKLIELAPKEATRVHGDHADRVPIEQLQVGDLIEVKPGEKVPMDGVVEQGRSDVNQAPVTGESTPVDVDQGSGVYAGSINGRAALLVRVTKLARDNTLARVVKMVQEAQAQRAPSQRFVDAFARYYTPMVIAVAAAVAVVPPLWLRQPSQPWLYRSLVLLVIACPCALVISTPVAIVAAISGAARKGVLIKGGAHLEALARVRIVAFDKTGTLTEGRAAVTDVELLTPSAMARFEGAPDRLLALAASIEAHSLHPVARAISEEAKRRGLDLEPVSEYTEIAGFGAQSRVNGQTYFIGKHGLFCERVPHSADICLRAEEVESEGKTAVLVSDEHHVLGLIAVADRVRASSAEVVQALRTLGMDDVVMLSGDNERTAAAIGAQAAIQNVQANLLPEDKVRAVERLLASDRGVAMVGDGVNDAPALARATVGIAMGGAGSDAALETADIVLMSDDLQRIPYAVELGRRTLGNIQQNVALSLVIKGLFLLLALSGVATLWMAVFADMGTSLLVTLNGLRLLRE